MSKTQLTTLLIHFLSQVYYKPTKSYTVNDQSYNDTQKTVNTNMTRVTVSSGLYPATTYTVFITSVNAAREGARSAPVSVALAPTGERGKLSW